jgi:FkbM family methyltransferase
VALAEQIRKVGRTAQVYVPFLQDFGKSVEAGLRRAAGRVHDQDLNGLRYIDLPRDALILDVGANRGAAIESLRMLAPQARIVAFEPNPAMAPRLQGQLARTAGVLHQAALGEVEGQFPLYLPVYRGVVFDGLASLSEREAAGWLGPHTLFGFSERKLEVRKVLCRVMPLDYYALAPHFIKIDVQGAEYAVLKGGLHTIARSEPIIFAESESLDIDATLALLADWRYAVFRHEPQGLVPGESRRNVYLVPASKLSLIRKSTV